MFNSDRRSAFLADISDCRIFKLDRPRSVIYNIIAATKIDSVDLGIWRFIATNDAHLILWTTGVLSCYLKIRNISYVKVGTIFVQVKFQEYRVVSH